MTIAMLMKNTLNSLKFKLARTFGKDGPTYTNS